MASCPFSQSDGQQLKCPLFSTSQDDVQKAANGLTFILQAPGNCMNNTADLPISSPSSNMAALWLRALFHDAGTFDKNTKNGGLDSSLMAFLNLTVNIGLKESLSTRFIPNINAKISNSDAIALGALVTVEHCGGPSNINFSFGRLDYTNSSSGPTSPVGLIPEANESFSDIMSKLFRMGLDYNDIVALVTGSHSMGGIHRKISPDLFVNVNDLSVDYIPFDTTPGVFDNDIFKQTLNGKCPLPFDCQIAKDPNMRPIVQKFATDQAAFFDQFQKSFEKILAFSHFGNDVKYMKVNIPLHGNLLVEGSLPVEASLATKSGCLVSNSNGFLILLILILRIML